MITQFFQRFFLMTVICSVIACSEQNQPDNNVQFLAHAAQTQSQMNEKWQIINYWAVWCKPCIEEIPALNQLAEEQQQLQVIGINFDKPEQKQLEQDVKKLGIEFPIALTELHQRYQYDYPKVLPTTVIVAPGGQVKTLLQGPQTADTILKAMAE